MNPILAALLLATSGQQATTEQKVDAIWTSVENRFIQQTDVWFDDGEFPMVVQLLRFHAEVVPQDYDVVTNLGWMLENIEQDEDAILVYGDYRKNNPTDPDRALPEGEFYFRNRNWEKVIASVAPHLSDGSHPNLFRVLAHAYDRVGQLGNSRETWKRYIQLAPDDLAAKANLKKVEEKIAKGS